MKGLAVEKIADTDFIRRAEVCYVSTIFIGEKKEILRSQPLLFLSKKRQLRIDFAQ
jgi:hypothetical protein